jgi:hypothetical protein
VLEFLGQPQLLPFAVALLLMVLIGAVQASGLGDALDFDDAGPLAGGLDWLNVGHVPVLVLLILFLLTFGLSGLLLQQLAQAVLGAPLHLLAAVPSAVGASVPATRGLSALLGRVLPGDETTAVPIESLVGRRARIVVGTARIGNPARARVEDVHGQAHFVLVEPEDETSFTAAAELLLTRREGDIFRAIEVEPDIFSNMRLTR